MTHPFAEFNKCENQGTLVGNWVEEHALKDLTGSFRYKAWVDHKNVEGDSVYPKHLTASRMETFGRVFEHSDKLESADWITHNHYTYSGLMKGAYREPKLAGKRMSATMKKAKKEAMAEPPIEVVKPDFTTTCRAAFTENDLTGLEIGARVMKTQDGLPVKRDHVFLSETKILDKYHAQKLCGKVFSETGPPEDAVTFYSTTKLE